MHLSSGRDLPKRLNLHDYSMMKENATNYYDAYADKDIIGDNAFVDLKELDNNKEIWHTSIEQMKMF